LELAQGDDVAGDTAALEALSYALEDVVISPAL
jgi:hypothetical protein